MALVLFRRGPGRTGRARDYHDNHPAQSVFRSPAHRRSLATAAAFAIGVAAIIFNAIRLIRLATLRGGPPLLLPVPIIFWKAGARDGRLGRSASRNNANRNVSSFLHCWKLSAEEFLFSVYLCDPCLWFS